MDIPAGILTWWGAVSQAKGIMVNLAEGHMLSIYESLYFQESPVRDNPVLMAYSVGTKAGVASEAYGQLMAIRATPRSEIRSLEPL